MTINEKVAYIKGMLEGMELDSKEAKLITAILEVLDEVGLALEDADASFDAIDEELNAINDELDEIEEVLDECCDEEDDEDEDWDEFDDEDFVEIDCPNCEQKFVIDLDDDCCCDDDDCDCGCHHEDEE